MSLKDGRRYLILVTFNRKLYNNFYAIISIFSAIL